METKAICQECGKKSITFDQFNILSLPIPSSHCLLNIKYFTEKDFQMSTNSFDVIAESIIRKIQTINDTINKNNNMVNNITNLTTGISATGGLAATINTKKR